MFSGLFGASNISASNFGVHLEAWQRLFSRHGRQDLGGHWQGGDSLLVESQQFNTPWSHHAQRVPLCDGMQAVAFWGRLDDREGLGRLLGVDVSSTAGLTDPQLVLAAWRRWGEELPEHLLGDFALAIVDARERRLFLARDPLGVKPLYYWPDPQGFLFATTVAALRVLPDRRPSPDEAWIARYLSGLSKSRENTAYREIHKLPPGHCLSVDGEGRQKLRRWHRFRDDAPPARRRERHWVEEYRELLGEAVRCRAASNYPLGTENSGGIDSAAVTTFLARQLDDPAERLHSFGVAISEQMPGYACETSQACGIHYNHLVTSPGCFDTDLEAHIPRHLQVLGYPFEDDNGTAHVPFYRECERHGIRTLLSGFGGDEAVTNSGRHLRWELIDGRLPGQLWEILPGSPLFRALRWTKALTVGRRRPAFDPGFPAVLHEPWPHQVIRPEAVRRYALRDAYMEWARFDTPYRRINDWVLNGQLARPNFSTRLENCSLVAASYGVDYRWPLCDVRLIQQYLSTPSIEKVGPKGIGRYLHRRAISDVVPHRVAWKPSKRMSTDRWLEERNRIRVRTVAASARRHESQLHPALDALIDRAKWRSQIEHAMEGGVENAFGTEFFRTTLAVQWLNYWLHDGAVDG